MVEYTSLRENLTSILKIDKALRSLKKYEKSLRIILKDKSSFDIFYYFIDSNNLRVEISLTKRGKQKKRCVDIEN